MGLRLPGCGGKTAKVSPRRPDHGATGSRAPCRSSRGGRLHSAAGLAGFFALGQRRSQTAAHFGFRGAGRTFRRPYHHGDFSQQIIGQGGGVFQPQEYKFLVFFGQFPANGGLARAKNGRGQK